MAKRKSITHKEKKNTKRIISTNDLPNGWVWTTLAEVIDKLESGGRPKGGAKGITEGIPSIGGEHLRYDGTFNFEDIRYVPEEYFQEMTRGKIEKYDVLVVKDGATTGKTSFVADDFPFSKAAVNEHVFILRVKQELVAPKYIFYWMQSSYGQKCVKENFQGTAQGGITTVFVQNSRFPLAPTFEQRRIAAEIEKQFARLNSGIAALKRAQENLKRYKASVLQAAVTGKLVPQDPDDEPAEKLLERIIVERREKWEKDLRAKGKDPKKAKYVEPASPETSFLPELPDGWTWATIDQLAAHEPYSITDGPFGSNLKTEHYTQSGPRVIRLQNIGDGEFRDAYAHISTKHFKTLSKHQIFAGDLVIAGLGESLPRACIIPDSVGKAIVKADCIRFKPHPSIGIVPYLNTALNSETLKKAATQIVHGVGRPRLNQQEVRSLPIPLPPIDEQRRIAVEVETRLTRAKELNENIASRLERAETLRQSILSSAFSGELVPQDSNDEPASVLLERIREERAQRLLDEKVQYATKKKERGARMPKTTMRKLIFDILGDNKKRMRPREIFDKAGFTAETIEEFYEELREEMRKGRIEQIRPNKTDVFLEVVKK